MIYICIPSYNEERTVGVLLWKVRQVMAEFPRDYHLLVLDDASDDATPDILAPYTRVLPLTVIRHTQRTGYADSLEELLREAVRRAPYPRRDVIVALQADFTEAPEHIPALVKRIEGGIDVVTSARDDRAAPVLPRWTRRAFGLTLRRFDWHESAGDPLSGFRAYRVVCLKKALAACNERPLLELDGWAANAELLRAVQPHARRMATAPVEVHQTRRGRATRFNVVDAARQFIGLLRIPPPTTPDDASAEEVVDVAGTGDRARAGGARRSDQHRDGRTHEVGVAAEASRSDDRQRRRGAGSGGRARRGRRPSGGTGTSEPGTGGEA